MKLYNYNLILQETFTQKWKFTHYLLALFLMEVVEVGGLTSQLREKA